MQRRKRIHSVRVSKVTIWLATCVSAVCFQISANAQTNVGVAVITDGPEYQMQDFAPTFRDELVALTTGEFDIDYLEFSGDWSRDSIESAFDAAYADPNVDLVLVSGFAATQLGGARASFPKPTFLPLMLNAELVEMPRSGNTSGKANLNYLTGYGDVCARS